MLNIEGLASGLDTSSIIEGLLSIQQAQVERYTLQKDELLEQRSAFKGIEARLLALQSSLGELSRPSTNVFLRKSVISSSEANIAASVSNDAAPGVYTISVNNLAQNNQVVSQVYNARDAKIAEGTISVGTANGSVTDLTIDSSNNTLEGLALLINSTVDDVTASLIRQGAGYQLLLSSNRSGVANALSISEVASQPSEASLLPGFDLANPVQAAQDADLQLGSGPGAISITSESNLVDDVFSGITLNLLKASPAESVTLTVSSDATAAREAITAFVDTYNSVIEYTAEQNSFDAETGTAGTLFGNRALLLVRDRLAQTITQPVPVTATERPNRLSALGLRIDAAGKLTIQSNQLDEVLNGQAGAGSLDDLQGLFGFSGESDSQFVQFLVAGSDTKPTPFVVANGVRTAEPYRIEVLQAAKQGSVLAANGVAATIVIDDTNNALSIEVDARTADLITLANGTYTPEELSSELEKVINSSDQLPGREVRVSVVNQQLQITSLTFGVSSSVGSIGGTARGVLGFDGSESATGQDTLGNFYALVDGIYVKEPASGQGRVLTGLDSNPNTAGLRIRTTLTQAQIGQGHVSTMTVTRGIAETLDKVVDDLLADEGENKRQGQLVTAGAEFNRRIESIDQNIERLNEQFESQRTSLLDQFNMLESRLAGLQNVGNILSAQLASLPRIGSQ